MCRISGRDGQTAVEWAGALALVAAVLAALVSLGLPATVAADVRQAVCTILGGHYDKPRLPAQGHPPAQSSGLDPTAPTSGPPIGAGVPIPVLPFTGGTVSYSTTCLPSNPENGQPGTGSSGGVGSSKGGAGASKEGGSSSKCGGPSKEGGGSSSEGDGSAEGRNGGPSFTIQGKITATDSLGNPTLNSNCQETQQLSVSADCQVSVEARAGKEGTGVSATGTQGVTVQYQLNLTPQQVGALRAGAMGTPNPLDPRTIPTGDSIVLNELGYKQLDLSGAYKGLTADLGYQNGRQVSSGIQSLGDGVVQVDVGDSQLVQNALTLGVDYGDVGASLGASNTFTDGKLRQVDININTPQGWATYQQFLHTGVLPSTSDPGVSNPATQQVVTDTSQLQAEAHAYGLSIGVGSNPSQLNVTETDNPDGSKTNTFNYQLGNVTEVITSNTDPGGANTGETYQLLLHNVSSGVLSDYAQLTGQPAAKYGSNQDVVLNFTATQLDALQQTADEQISATTHQPGYGPPMSPQQVQRYFQQHPYGVLPGSDAGLAGGIPLWTLAAAKNPAQILQAIQFAGNGDASGTLYRLGAFPHESGHPRLGHWTSPGARVCSKNS